MEFPPPPVESLLGGLEADLQHGGDLGDGVAVEVAQYQRDAPVRLEVRQVVGEVDCGALSVELRVLSAAMAAPPRPWPRKPPAKVIGSRHASRE